jgi:hypothetical protein
MRWIQMTDELYDDISAHANPNVDEVSDGGAIAGRDDVDAVMLPIGDGVTMITLRR